MHECLTLSFLGISTTIAVKLHVHLGSLLLHPLKDQFDNFEMASFARDVKRCESGIVDCVHIGSALNEQLRDGLVTVDASAVQRRPSIYDIGCVYFSFTLIV